MIALLEKGVVGHVYDPDPAIQALFVEAQRYHDEMVRAGEKAVRLEKEMRDENARADALSDLRDKVLAAIERLR